LYEPRQNKPLLAAPEAAINKVIDLIDKKHSIISKTWTKQFSKSLYIEIISIIHIFIYPAIT